MSRLKACRMCLAVDARMYDIVDTPLQDIYEGMTKKLLQSQDGKPVMACYVCHHLLTKWLIFTERSLRAEELLQQMLDRGLELTQATISSSTLKPSLVYSSEYVIHLVEPEVPVKNEDVDIKFKDEWNENVPEDATDDISQPLVSCWLADSGALKTPRVVQRRTKKGIKLKNSSGKTRGSQKGVLASKILRLDQGIKDEALGALPLDSELTIKIEEDRPRSNDDATQKSVTANLQNDPIKPELMQVKTEKIENEDCLVPQGTTEECNSIQKHGKTVECFECPHCDKVFFRKSRLAKHKKTHKGIKYRCNSCTKTFCKKLSLQNHMRTHNGEKQYICHFCSKAFAAYSNLSAHIYNVHSQMKPYRCSHCNRDYKTKSYLAKHIIAKHGVKGETPFRCDVCGKSYPWKFSLRIHMFSHTGERPYKCSVCSKAFKQHSTWKGHMRVHTGEKPYSCDLCDRSFRKKSDVKQHMITHSDEKRHPCERCGKAFKHIGNLRAHFKTHCQESFCCERCGDEFSSSRALLTHSKTHTFDQR